MFDLHAELKEELLKHFPNVKQSENVFEIESVKCKNIVDTCAELQEEVLKQFPNVENDFNLPENVSYLFEKDVTNIFNLLESSFQILKGERIVMSIFMNVIDLGKPSRFGAMKIEMPYLLVNENTHTNCCKAVLETIQNYLFLIKELKTFTIEVMSETEGI